MIIYVNVTAGRDGNGTKEMPFRHINDAAQIQADGHVFEVCTGNRAGAAASTAAHVNEKTFL